MFQFPAFASLSDTETSSRWVAPFGYLRIKRYVLLPAAFRSLSRPSSPLRSKASPVRPSQTSSSHLSYQSLYLIARKLKSLSTERIQEKFLFLWNSSNFFLLYCDSLVTRIIVVMLLALPAQPV